MADVVLGFSTEISHTERYILMVRVVSGVENMAAGVTGHDWICVGNYATLGEAKDASVGYSALDRKIDVEITSRMSYVVVGPNEA